MPSFKHRSFVERGGRALGGSEAVDMGGDEHEQQQEHTTGTVSDR